MCENGSLDSMAWHATEQNQIQLIYDELHRNILQIGFRYCGPTTNNYNYHKNRVPFMCCAFC